MFLHQPRRPKFRNSHRSTIGFEPLEQRQLLATITVVSSGDSGPGTLRDAIELSNRLVGHDTIQFALPLNDTLIKPITGLPEVTDSVTIDASTQPGYIGKPIVELSGQDIPGTASGLVISAGKSIVRGLIINSFSSNGIFITGLGSNQILGNFIGTDASGQTAKSNAFIGVVIVNSHSNWIGGVGADGNLISGNLEGVRIDGATSFGNKVQGNKIGTNLEGALAIPNTLEGILIENGAFENIIGVDSDGTHDAEEGNLISGNNRNGIRVFGAIHNTIAGNLIGLDATHSSPLPNQASGVLIDFNSSRNLIGSNGDGLADDLEQNWIAGNQLIGVQLIQSTRNQVSGNIIGAQLVGQTNLGNTLEGVLLSNFSNSNLIGFQDGVGIRNVISGNGRNGIMIDRSSDNVVAGNYVGTNAAGNLALGNLARGIQIQNGAFGNRIGTNANQQFDNSERNIISGNASYGISMEGFSTNTNDVLGNIIGADVTGLQSIGNGDAGVFLGDARQIRIGDGTAVGSNTIAFNKGNGIAITGASAYANTVATNSILGNDGIPIDLGNDGRTANDSLDSDLGPNQLQNHPSVILAASDGHQTLVFGSIDTLPNFPVQLLLSSATLHVQNFVSVNADHDASKYLNQAEVDRTNSVGRGYWLQTSDVTTSLGQQISSNVTDVFGNTSEFSIGQSVVELMPITVTLSSVNENDKTVRATIQRGRIASTENLVIQLSSTDPSSATVPASVVMAPGQSSVDFDIHVIDDHIYEGNRNVFVTAIAPQGIGAVQVQIVEDDIYWHNRKPGLGNDVDDDGAITPLDVLAIVNLLNSSFVRDLSVQTPLTPLRYIDTDNDAFLSPLDALVVINAFNARGSGEGEFSIHDRAISQLELSRAWSSDIGDESTELPNKSNRTSSRFRK